MSKPIGVGIIGVNADRGWAASAHIPALKAMPDDFRIVAVSSTRQESADASAKAFGIEAAYDNHAALLANPGVDLVAVNVKVPHHFELVTAALDAGKMVYCEWPLGRNLGEAKLMAEQAKKLGLRTVIGLQAAASPPVNYVRDLVKDGYIGEVLSTTLVGSAMGWGSTVSQFASYALDATTGATVLAIPAGHTLDAVAAVLGEFASVSATFTTRFPTVKIAETGETVMTTTPDHIAFNGLLKSGALASVHYRGGISRGTNLLWEINGTEGDLRLTADGGHAQIFDLTVYGAKGKERKLELLPVPGKYRWIPDEVKGPAVNVGQNYAWLAKDIREGTHLAPDFDDAVRRHRLLAAIEESAATGKRVELG